MKCVTSNPSQDKQRYILAHDPDSSLAHLVWPSATDSFPKVDPVSLGIAAWLHRRSGLETCGQPSTPRKTSVTIEACSDQSVTIRHMAKGAVSEATEHSLGQGNKAASRS